MKLLSILLLFAGLLFSQVHQAQALPIVGSNFYYEGGNVEVKILQNSAGYTSEIFLVSKLTGNPVALGNTQEVGKVVSLGDLSAYGYHVGDAVIFGITVLNTGDRFFMGSGSVNPDGVAHAQFYYADGPYGDYALLGFEDLFGGGDRDYNDAAFRVTGVGVGLLVPEPASLLLTALGLASIFAVRRRRSIDK